MSNEVVETTAVAVRPTEQVEHKPETKALVKPKTSQEMRVIEVNEALLPAYQRASTLELTETEIGNLMGHFPDDAVEIRPHDGLIYIPHILISDRLNWVFGPGKWALICRRHWLEGTTMYGEYILLIRGCYVGESVGGHPYQPNNPKTNYSDTLESTAAEALRRIAGKRLSCGSQVWNPDYARKWVAKYAVQERNGKWFRHGTPAPEPAKSAPQPTVSAPQKANPAPEPEGSFEDAAPVEVPRDDNAAQPDEWRDFPMPWGDHAGTALCELDKKYLYGLWANFKVETEYNGNRKSPEVIGKDTKFRALLDDAAAHYKFTKKA